VSDYSSNLAEDAHLRTKRSYEREPSRRECDEAKPSERSDDSAPSLLRVLRRR
jgi:hypothetical protein